MRIDFDMLHITGCLKSCESQAKIVNHRKDSLLHTLKKMDVTVLWPSRSNYSQPPPPHLHPFFFRLVSSRRVVGSCPRSDAPDSQKLFKEFFAQLPTSQTRSLWAFTLKLQQLVAIQVPQETNCSGVTVRVRSRLKRIFHSRTSHDFARLV